VQIDHVLIAVPDLDASARELEARYGLGSVDGGRHPGWGTANRIVPLGDTYLELIGVVDSDEAAGSAFGRAVAAAAPSQARLLGWAARADDIDAVADRLGLPVHDGSREAIDGRLLRWRLAGVEDALAEPALPFFIEWGPDTPHPGSAATELRIAELRLSGSAERLTTWLGGELLPVDVVEGQPALTAVIIRGPGVEIVLGTAPF